MAATEPLYLRLAPGLKDRIVAAARKDGLSANEWASEVLRRALASGAGAGASTGLPVVSAPVASDGALGEREVSKAGGTDASPLPEPIASRFSRSPSAAEVAAQVPGVSTAGDLVRSQVTPLPKGGKR